jgi:Leucine-rich repeat (LRR) protein
MTEDNYIRRFIESGNFLCNIRQGLWLEIQKLDCSYSFAHRNGSDAIALSSKTAVGDLYLLPRPLPEVDRQPIAIVGLPDEGIKEARLLSPTDLYEKVKSHIRKYVDMAELDLDQLFLDINQISDLSPLASLTNLTRLGLSQNGITDLSPLTSLINLTDLGLYGNQISDLSPLASLTNLTRLDLEQNPLSSASIDVYIPQFEKRGVAVSW